VIVLAYFSPGSCKHAKISFQAASLSHELPDGPPANWFTHGFSRPNAPRTLHASSFLPWMKCAVMYETSKGGPPDTTIPSVIRHEVLGRIAMECWSSTATSITHNGTTRQYHGEREVQ
jgi:hypothetical protein